MPTATVRNARFSELTQIAHIFAAAFRDEPLFGEVIHPNRDKFPDDMHLFWLRGAQVAWWDPSCHILVSTVTDAAGKETISGSAFWERMQTAEKGFSISNNLIKPLASFYTRLSSWIWPNRAADPAQEDVLERLHPYLEDVWVGPRADGWYLEFLGVHPDQQGAGSGRALVAWGMERAQRERVCASVISAAGKENFYQRCGFDTQDKWAGQGEGNPVAHVPGGLIFFKDFTD